PSGRHAARDQDLVTRLGPVDACGCSCGPPEARCDRGLRGLRTPSSPHYIIPPQSLRCPQRIFCKYAELQRESATSINSDPAILRTVDSRFTTHDCAAPPASCHPWRPRPFGCGGAAL